LHEGTNDVDTVKRLEFIEEGVSKEFDVMEVLKPSTPSQVALGVCTGFDSCCLGLLSKSEVSHETVSSGRGYKVNELGT
jgi:hypothetical protein